MLLTSCGNPFIENYRATGVAAFQEVLFVPGREVEADKKEMLANGYEFVGNSIVKEHSMGLKGKAVSLGRLIGASHVYFYEEEFKRKTKHGVRSTDHQYQAWYYKKKK